MTEVMNRRARVASAVALTGAIAAVVASTAGAAHAQPSTVHSPTTTQVFAAGGSLSDPDDIALLGGHVFVAYQNGVG